MIRPATPADTGAILALYRSVAAVPDALARTPDEVTDATVAGFMGRAAQNGVNLLWDEDGRVLGEIHASRLGIACFDHVLTDLTIAVAPVAQGRGVGRALFQALLHQVIEHMPAVTRVELYARESNTRARALYTSLGFEEEGRLRGRVQNTSGKPEADIVMGWLRPGSSD